MLPSQSPDAARIVAPPLALTLGAAAALEAAAPAPAPLPPPSVRWATLLGEVTRLAEAFPADAQTLPRRRRYGDPPLAAVETWPAWLDDAAAHVLGVISRCAGMAPETAVAAQDAQPNEAATLPPAVVEALLMTAVADHLLGVRQPWAGRPYWQAHPLAARLAGRPLLTEALRLAMRRAMAARDERIHIAARMIDRAGLAPALALASGEDTLRALAPPPPVPRQAGPGPGRALPRHGLPAAALGVALAAVVAFGAWHTAQWHDMRDRLAPLLSAEP